MSKFTSIFYEGDGCGNCPDDEKDKKEKKTVKEGSEESEGDISKEDRKEMEGKPVKEMFSVNLI